MSQVALNIINYAQQIIYKDIPIFREFGIETYNLTV